MKRVHEYKKGSLLEERQVEGAGLISLDHDVMVDEKLDI